MRQKKAYIMFCGSKINGLKNTLKTNQNKQPSVAVESNINKNCLTKFNFFKNRNQ